MLKILSNRTYRHLFAAQIVALIGTGLATVALGLLAFELAGEDAGTVVGTALAIKMVALVTLAPIASAFADRVPRRTMLVMLDLIRAVVALCLPFVTEVWQIYALIFLLQAASAGFTPTFQATIPDILPDEADYTRALSLSRLAYDMESLLSPILAAALLTVVSFPVLFGGTVIGFLASAMLVLTVALPSSQPSVARGIWDRTTRGMRIYLATPRLRGVLALNLTVAAGGAMVIVNTVVIVRAGFGLQAPDVALALAAYGGGSMTAAFLLPKLLDRYPDRAIMLAGAFLLASGMAAGVHVDGMGTLLPLWVFLGLGYSLAMTPTGRLLRRSAHAADRPALFAAHFALSHACWLIAYPLAGRFGAAFGMPATFLVMAVIGALGFATALWLWPARESTEVEHDHAGMAADHPHLANAHGAKHRHDFVIDDNHRRWPARRG